MQGLELNGGGFEPFDHVISTMPLTLLVRGLPNRGIAEQLVITPKTVENHVEHIYAKIEASNRAGASLFVMRHGLFPEEQLVAYAAV